MNMNLIQRIEETLEAPEVLELCETDGMEATGVYLCKLLRESIETLKSQEWRKWPEEKPEKNDLYLVTFQGRKDAEPLVYHDGEWDLVCSDDEEDEFTIIAWMPLPAPYAETKEGAE